MGELSYQRTVIAYHGCDESVVTDVLLRGQQLKASANDYDWLGRGIYFWEHGPRRALEWAQWRARVFKNIRQPAVLGAFVNLGHCFDLLDTAYTRLLSEWFPLYRQACERREVSLPRNLPAGSEDFGDWVLRHLDCAVINWYLDLMEKEEGQHFHTVRCVFSEGNPVYDGSKIMAKSHIQIAVRDASAIVGYFKPNIDNLPG